MEFIIIFLAIVCLIETWIIIEVGRETDRTKNEGNGDIESLIEVTNERDWLKEQNESLLERLAEMEGWLEPECTCHYEETCAGFPEHNMTKEEMAQELRSQYDQELKALEARRMAWLCPQCGKRGGCYCNGMTSSGEIFRHSDDIQF